MKIKNLIIAGVAILAFGVGLIDHPSIAQAYAYNFSKPVHHYVPRSWRGTYTHGSRIMTFNTYSISLDGSTLYKSNWSGYRNLAFAKMPRSTHYLINAYAKVGYQSSQSWRLTTKNGQKVLINYQNMGNTTVWYKNERLKKFHGYKIEGLKGLNESNTYYAKDIHCIISPYKPTQTSKVIFKYGSHVYPTHHQWLYTHGNSDTSYMYRKGHWELY